MPLKIIKRHGSPNFYLRGTVRKIVVDESTGTDDWDAAEAIRIQREAEILDRSVHGVRKTARFLEAAVSYMENGGSPRFIDPLLDHFGTTPLVMIGQAEIERAARALYPNAKPGTRNRQVFTPVSAIMHHAAKRGLCGYVEFDRPKVKDERVQWITPDEADRLIEAASPHLKPMLIFLFYTGARVSEMIYLDWRQVDLQRQHVAFLETKNGEPRGVPLHTRVVVALSNLPHRDGRVFRRPDGQGYALVTNAGGQIKTAFNGACRRAGISDFRPHDCRHTWATWHYQANRNLAALKLLGGWKSERKVLRYAHHNVEDSASSIDALPWGKFGDGSIGKSKKERKTKI